MSAGLLTRRQLASAPWRRLLRDVYLHRDAELDHLVWCNAAALLLPVGGAISGTSAAYLYGADILPRDPPVEVSIPRNRVLPAHPKLRAWRARLDPGDIRRSGELPVTIPLRTAFDLARRGRTEAVIGLDALLNRRVIDKEEIREYARARTGWPGVAGIPEALALARPAESPMETRLRLVIVDAGLPCPAVQHEVYDGDRFVARVNLAYPGLKLGIEYDGDHHRDRVTFRRDVARLNALRAVGWTIPRFTADDVLRHPERLVHQVMTVARGIR